MLKIIKTGLFGKVMFGISVFMLLSMVYCDDFLETDISDKKVQIYSPSNNLVTESSKLTFWWDSIETANDYNVVIVSKSFAEIETIFLDTTLSKTRIQKTIPVGQYQWRVSASNGSSTAYSDTFSLTIEASGSQ